MSNHICWLITILLDTNNLYRIAVKVNRDKLNGDCAEYPREPENEEQILKILPEYYSNHYSIKILEVQEILDIVIVNS